MLNFLLVGAGGFFGAILRYGVSLAMGRLHISGSFPWATLLVNLLGAFFIGFLSQFFALRLPDQKRLLLFLTTGVLGGFTTFSTFSLETVNLWEQGSTVLGVVNLVLSVALCLLGVFLGKLLAKHA